jgi:hypothetical protein
MTWIMFFQTPYDAVKFITNEDDSYQILNYYKFVDFISDYKIENRQGIIQALDRFQTILLNCVEGTWEIQKVVIIQGSFEEMLKLNPGELELKESKKKTDPILKNKNFINTFFKARKKQVMKK